MRKPQSDADDPPETAARPPRPRRHPDQQDFMIFLGSPDTEMRAIMDLCEQMQLAHATGQYQGYRAKGRNAFNADDFRLANGSPFPPERWNYAICVESHPQDMAIYASKRDPSTIPQMFRIDHHFPEDPGYGGDPAEYMRHASVGQFLDTMARLGIEPPFSERKHPWSEPTHSLLPGVQQLTDPQTGESEWSLVIARDHFPPRVLEIPQSIQNIAAADHCLRDAYQGNCPGVDPKSIMDMRVQRKAAERGEPPEAITRRIDKSIELLQRLSKESRKGFVGLPVPPSELPEAAAWTGVDVLYQSVDRDSQKPKTFYHASNAEKLQAWQARMQNLGWHTYGDPNRGFIGAAWDDPQRPPTRIANPDDPGNPKRSIPHRAETSALPSGPKTAGEPQEASASSDEVSTSQDSTPRPG